VEKYLVRAAQITDAEEITGLANELAVAVGDTGAEFDAVRDRLGELLEERRAGVFVAEDGGGRVVGVVSYWIKPDLAHGDAVVEIPMLAVAESARREGIGKALLARVQDEGARKGANLIELVATSQNVVAREFYRSLGFVEADVISLEFVGDLQDPPEQPESTS
jgi:ribosomal protein S18 acetylase RimI-like enzyme